jgi:hypothetical protein
MTEHRHPRCVTPARGVAPSDAQTIAELRREVGDLKLQHEAVVADRDALLESWGRATEALGLPEGHEVDKVIAELEGKRCISGDACECLECEVRLLRRLRNADRTEWMTTYETMRALIEQYRHEDVGPFSDGELSPWRADGFRVHLATCAACQAAHLEILQQAILSTVEPKGDDHG